MTFSPADISSETVLTVTLVLALLISSTTVTAQRAGITPFRVTGVVALLGGVFFSNLVGWPFSWLALTVVFIGVLWRLGGDLTRRKSQPPSWDLTVATLVTSLGAGATAFVLCGEPGSADRFLAASLVASLVWCLFRSQSVVSPSREVAVSIGRVIGYAIAVSLAWWWPIPFFSFYFVVLGSLTVWESARQWGEPLFLVFGTVVFVGILGGGLNLGLTLVEVGLCVGVTLGHRFCAEGFPGLSTLMMAFPPRTDRS